MPLSLGELTGADSNLLNQLVSEPRGLVERSAEPMTRREYMQLVSMGGFPDAVFAPNPRARGRWHSSYVSTVVNRDIQDIASVHRADVLPQLMRALAALTANELNLTELARTLGADNQTVRGYLSLFETTYLFTRLPAWSGSQLSRVRKRPKIHLTDSGIAAHLVGQDADALARPDNHLSGALLETFVVNELLKLSSSSDVDVRLFHFRDHEQREVDVVLELPDGRVVGIEVKASATVDARDFRHVRYLESKLGDRLLAGVIFNTGRNAVPFGDRLFALPVSWLWDGARPDQLESLDA